MTKEQFYERWLSAFACGISREDLERYVVTTGNFIWHIFSWELIDGARYLSDDEARAAFDKTKKDGAEYISWFYMR